jgi:hypothetical protein
MLLTDSVEDFCFICRLQIVFSPTLGKNQDQQSFLIISRIEKGKCDEFAWFLDTLNAGLPRIKDKLTMLSSIADHIILHCSLKDMEQLEIESEEWVAGRRNFMNHGLRAVPPPQRRNLGMTGRWN